MKSFGQTSIRRKLTTLILLGCTLVLFVALAFSVVHQVYYHKQTLLEKQASLARVVSTNSRLPLIFHDTITAERILSSLAAEPQIRHAYIFDRNHQPFAQYINPDRLETGGAEDTNCQYLTQALANGRADYCFSLSHLGYFQPIYHQGDQIGMIYLQSDLNALYGQLAAYGLAAILLFLLIALLAYPLAARLQQVISRPILHLAEVVERVSATQDFSIRADRKTDDEVGVLIDGFNEMLAQLQARDRKLQEYQAELEAKVDQRTKELREANQTLESTVEELEEAKKAAEAASLAKSRFLATMSHEIRTPMIGVLGMTELLAQGDLAPRQRSLAQTAYKSGEVLLSLLNDILDFSKIEAGKLDLEMTDFDLRQVVEDVVELFAGHTRNKPLQMACDIPPDLPFALRGDSARLRQVLLNLIGNAVKFTEEGEVLVRVESRREDETTVTLGFAIRDTGIGISEEAQRRIFDSFSQADNSTTRHYGGSGLGLAIVRELITLMGGTIIVESRPGEGTVFRFDLTLDKQADAGRRIFRLPRRHRGKTVLVVDPHATGRSTLLGYLSACGLESIGAENPAAACDLLPDPAKGGDAISLVVIDDGFPGPDIEKCLQALSASSVSPPVLLLSTAGQGESVLDGYGSAVSTLSKPPRPSQIGRTVVRLLDRPTICTLPAGTAAKDKPPPPPGDDLPSRKVGKILLAEDNPEVQKLLKLHLESRGYEVELVTTGKEAVTLFATRKFDLVFMDYNMPEMDGPEATRIIREHDVRTPIIAMTAHTRKDCYETFNEAGVSDYLRKPFKQQQLVDILEKWRKGSEQPNDDRRPEA